VTKQAAPLAALVLAACAEGSGIAPPTGAQLLLEATAKGTNVYSCEDRRGLTWILQEKTEETLYDSHDRPMGKARWNFPYSMRWQSNDGSVLVAQIDAREEGSAGVDIPSLLFKTVSHQGDGFAKVQAVQRRQSRGGVPPGRDCPQKGIERRIDYSAVYGFYGASR
jgi:hypothetical protein